MASGANVMERAVDLVNKAIAVGDVRSLLRALKGEHNAVTWYLPPRKIHRYRTRERHGKEEKRRVRETLKREDAKRASEEKKKEIASERHAEEIYTKEKSYNERKPQKEKKGRER